MIIFTYKNASHERNINGNFQPENKTEFFKENFLKKTETPVCYEESYEFILSTIKNWLNEPLKNGYVKIRECINEGRKCIMIENGSVSFLLSLTNCLSKLKKPHVIGKNYIELNGIDWKINGFALDKNSFMKLLEESQTPCIDLGT